MPWPVIKSSSRHAAVSSVFRFLTILRNFCILRLSFLPASPGNVKPHPCISVRFCFTRYCLRVAQTVTDFADASHSKSAKSTSHHDIIRHFQFRKCLPAYSHSAHIRFRAPSSDTAAASDHPQSCSVSASINRDGIIVHHGLIPDLDVKLFFCKYLSGCSIRNRNKSHFPRREIQRFSVFQALHFQGIYRKRPFPDSALRAALTVDLAAADQGLGRLDQNRRVKWFGKVAVHIRIQVPHLVHLIGFSRQHR